MTTTWTLLPEGQERPGVPEGMRLIHVQYAADSEYFLPIAQALVDDPAWPKSAEAMIEDFTRRIIEDYPGATPK